MPPAHNNAVSLSTTAVHKSGDVLRFADDNAGVSFYTLFSASSIMKGLSSSSTRASAAAGDVLISINASGVAKYYQINAPITAAAFSAAVSIAGLAGVLDKTDDITDDSVIDKDFTGNAYWIKSPWVAAVEAELDSDFSDDITSQLADETNTAYWSKTHFGNLEGSR